MSRLEMLPFLTIFTLLCQAASAPIQSRSMAEVLQRHVVGSNVEEETIEGAFLTAMGQARVSGGVIRRIDCKDVLTVKKLSVPDGSLRDALDRIVERMPTYRWQADQGVVNLLAVAETPPLLDVRIARYEAENVEYLQAAVAELEACPEVHQALSALHLTSGIRILTGPAPLKAPTPFTVRCRNVTFREALNAIVRAHGGAVWEYKERHCDGANEFWVEFVSQWRTQ